MWQHTLISTTYARWTAAGLKASLKKDSSRFTNIPSVRFTSCDPIKPVNLVEGESAELTMRIERGETETGPVEVKVTRLDFDGSEGQIASSSPDALRNLAGNESYVYNLKPRDDKTVLKVSKPGIYTISEAKDKYCTGDIKEPYQCFVLTVPKPKADINFEPITDVCAGEVGVKAHMLLTGEPPFEIGYYVRYPANLVTAAKSPTQV